MEETSIISVGIDIGTTTTQLVLSRLTLRNTAGPTQVPRYAITDRAILYNSPVALTPKLTRPNTSGSPGPQSMLDIMDTAEGFAVRDVIDEDALTNMIETWCHDSGIPKNNITTGAVIITGESLKTRNARQVVMNLSDALGDFVVATAGPNLESVIAGRGSGAAALSINTVNKVLNIDIGGGTSNYAVFDHGTAIDTSCLNIGGRLVETGPDGSVSRLHAAAVAVLEDLYGTVPATLHSDHLTAMATLMANMLYDEAIGVTSPLSRTLLQTKPLQAGHIYDAVCISGGVGACCVNPPTDSFRYGDIGPLLARAILANPTMRSLPLRQPASTVQATVIGAGAWSLSLSGSTVWVHSNALPLRNVPVVTVPLTWPDVPQDLDAHIRQQISLYDVNSLSDPFVLAFGDLPATYQVVQYLGQGVGSYMASLPDLAHPCLVAVKQDIGKALGLELRHSLGPRQLVVIDEVKLLEGDYLDLGKPLQQGGFVPLVIKSLAFSGGA